MSRLFRRRLSAFDFIPQSAYPRARLLSKKRSPTKLLIRTLPDLLTEFFFFFCNPLHNLVSVSRVEREHSILFVVACQLYKKTSPRDKLSTLISITAVIKLDFLIEQ